MFVKTYRYRVKKENLDKLIKINKEAGKIYKKYGGQGYKTLLKKDGRTIGILLLEFYQSKKQFNKIMNLVNKDKKITDLWKKFLLLVNEKEIKEEEFELTDD
ncbi:hypothetical protein HY030_03050 [Candidatus Gottesmanbacteria bacterium]|nr:hypothetical protein [Candidatus Gottesmanbacteria bacterium]